MNHQTSRVSLPGLAIVLAGLLANAPATAQQDRAAERNARRAQMQTQALQQQLQQAQADKTRIEVERTELEKTSRDREQQAARAQAALRAADARLKDSEAARQALADKVAALEKAMEEQQRQGERAVAAKDGELAQAAQFMKSRNEAQGELQTRFAEQVRLVTECSEKNERLVRLGGELIDRYRSKGPFDALRQRDPLIGLNDVQMFNLVQDYRDRAQAEQFTPMTERR